jgi:phosphohistidine phosphatase
MRDFDRPLAAGGLRDADAVGAAMLAAGHVPDRVICSTARRAKETWEAVARTLRAPRDVVLTERLYTADATGYADLIVENESVGTLLIVGHNPMTEDVCFALAPDGDAEAVAARASGFPTCGLAVIHFPGSLSAAAPSKGRLEAFVTPADL